MTASWEEPEESRDGLPPLGTDERLEIEVIRDRLRKRGYEMKLHPLGGRWVALLHRKDITSGTAPYAPGPSPLEASQNAWTLYEQSPGLKSFEPTETEPEDLYFSHPLGTLLVREGTPIHPWLVTWLPDDEKDPAFPGFTLSSTETQFPTRQGVPGVLQWASAQPWAQPRSKQTGTEEAQAPPAASPLDPSLRAKAFMRHSFEFAFEREPDDSYSWVVGRDGEVLQSGTADDWDDAKLSALEHVYPPSDEEER